MIEPGRMPKGILDASKLYIIYQLVGVELLSRTRETRRGASIVNCERTLHRVKSTMAMLGSESLLLVGMRGRNHWRWTKLTCVASKKEGTTDNASNGFDLLCRQYNGFADDFRHACHPRDSQHTHRTDLLRQVHTSEENISVYLKKKKAVSQIPYHIISGKLTLKKARPDTIRHKYSTTTRMCQQQIVIGACGHITY
jgi:hypothetical protein